MFARRTHYWFRLRRAGNCVQRSFALTLHLKVLIEIRIVRAGMLQNFPIWTQRKDDISIPRFRERLRILHGDVVLQRIVIYAAKALDNVQILSVAMTQAVKPGLVVEPDRIHYKRVALPPPDGVAHVRRIPITRMSAAICPDFAQKVIELEAHEHAPRDLNDLHGDRMKINARHARRKTSMRA